MDNISQKDIDWLLNMNQSRSRPGISDSSGKRKLWIRIIFWAMVILGMVVLPFFLLIRTSIFLSMTYALNGWIALAGGAFSTILLLLVYIFILFRRTPNKKILLKSSFIAISTLVLAFCFYGVMYISSFHAKNDEIRHLYRSLHPILRVAVTTTTLADSDLVITDIQRQPEDYAAMGIPLNQRSLHFRQETGYVHAIDLRTIGRNEVRNFLIHTSFQIMGLHTLRHVGTADHLHISLPVSY